MMPQETSANNKRIAKNTALLYVRMLVMMAVSLYTSRVVLRVLGIDDFGIYNVVGGVVTMFAFLNSSMSISVQRFLSFELGKKNEESQINIVYSVSFLIHLLIAAIIFLITESLGIFFLDELNIPMGRQNAAHAIFHISVLTTCISVIQIPFTGLIIAKEKMDAYAYISIVEVCLRLALVYLLSVLPFDRLICYAYLLLGSSIVVCFAYYLYCRYKISQVQLAFFWNKTIVKKMLSFASYSLFGEVAWTAVGQGVTVTLNLFFPPAINAARAIAIQASCAIKKFVDNFQMAINPQIVKLYAAGERNDMLKLCYRGTRLSFYLLLLISAPFIFCADFILNIWLEEVPIYTTAFCILALLGFLFDILSNLLSTVVKATGNIRTYQLIVSVILFLNLPFSYLCLALGFSPESVYWVYIIVSFALLFVRLRLLRPMVGISIKDYCKSVLNPIIKTTLTALILPIIIYWYVEHTVWNSLSLAMLSFLLISLSIYYVGLESEEKNFVRQKINFFLCKRK